MEEDEDEEEEGESPFPTSMPESRAAAETAGKILR
jgi:hypothetical protein